MEAVAVPKMAPTTVLGQDCKITWLLVSALEAWRPWRCPRWRPLLGHYCKITWLLVSAWEGWRPWRCPRWRPLLGNDCKLLGFWCLLQEHGCRGDAQDGTHYLDMIVNDLAFGVCLRSMDAVAMPKMAPTFSRCESRAASCRKSWRARSMFTCTKWFLLWVRRSSDVVLRLAVRQARAEFESLLGTPGMPSTERRAIKKQKWTLGERIYEWMYCTKKYRNKQKEWLIWCHQTNLFLLQHY